MFTMQVVNLFLRSSLKNFFFTLNNGLHSERSLLLNERPFVHGEGIHVCGGFLLFNFFCRLYDSNFVIFLSWTLRGRMLISKWSMFVCESDFRETFGNVPLSDLFFPRSCLSPGEQMKTRLRGGIFLISSAKLAYFKRKNN